MAIFRIKKNSTVGDLEKKLNFPAGTLRNKDGRKTRCDKFLSTIIKANKR